jgi:divalent metal cation (Fe/Co/Zn/Cd) transporter
MNTSLLNRGFYLEYLTLAWNVIGSAIIIGAAYLAGSVALAGFGIDSLIEIFASVVVVWQLRGGGKERERRALRRIGVAFLALAVYVLVQSVRTLVNQAHPATSPFGMVWLAATVAVMLLLAWGKHRTGKQLDNPVLLTESRVTLVDAYLAAAVLVGVALNALLGWWWADPLAGLVIVYYGIREGLHAYRESTAA